MVMDRAVQVKYGEYDPDYTRLNSIEISKDHDA